MFSALQTCFPKGGTNLTLMFLFVSGQFYNINRAIKWHLYTIAKNNYKMVQNLICDFSVLIWVLHRFFIVVIFQSYALLITDDVCIFFSWNLLSFDLTHFLFHCFLPSWQIKDLCVSLCNFRKGGGGQTFFYQVTFLNLFKIKFYIPLAVSILNFHRL